MITRKILKVKTLGSRKTGDLRPAFSEQTPEGINYSVHEYNESEGWCIVEFWGSDHSILPAKQRINVKKIRRMTGHSSVIAELQSHPSSPLMLAQIGVVLASYKLDEKKKIIIDEEDISHPYLRVSKETKRAGRDSEEQKIVIVDEG